MAKLCRIPYQGHHQDFQLIGSKTPWERGGIYNVQLKIFSLIAVCIVNKKRLDINCFINAAFRGIGQTLKVRIFLRKLVGSFSEIIRTRRYQVKLDLY